MLENAVWYLRRNRLFERISDDVVSGCAHLFVQRTYPKAHCALRTRRSRCMSRMEDLFGIMSRNPLIAINIAKYLHEQRDAALTAIE
jgi:hypothetical protein